MGSVSSEVSSSEGVFESEIAALSFRSFSLLVILCPRGLTSHISGVRFWGALCGLFCLPVWMLECVGGLFRVSAVVSVLPQVFWRNGPVSSEVSSSEGVFESESEIAALFFRSFSLLVMLCPRGLTSHISE